MVLVIIGFAATKTSLLSVVQRESGKMTGTFNRFRSHLKRFFIHGTGSFSGYLFLIDGSGIKFNTI